MPAFLLLAMVALPGAGLADTVVVCPREFVATLKPWVAHREAQGHSIRFVSSRHSAEQIRGEIREAADRGSVRAILLVGDAVDGQGDRSLQVPTHLAKARVNVKWGSEPEFATDNWYADLDDDRVPDVAIGRLTADSKEELAVMIRKLLAYEKTPPSDWQRRINCVAGVGGFGFLADAVLESATKSFLTEEIPAAYDVSMTYGSWRSAYCPDPRRFGATAVQRLNEGCLFWVYIGHGAPTFLDYIRVPGGAFPILSTQDAQQLKCRRGSPIAIFLACYTGAFDRPQDCLAESMLRAPGGPVAVLGGSRVTMPYAMSVLATGLMDEYFRERRETLGEALLRAKRTLAAPRSPLAEQDLNRANHRQMVDAIAAAISPSAELLDEERMEHVQLFNLLGDPWTRLPRPSKIVLTAPETARPGERVAIDCDCALAGTCRVELTCRRDRSKGKPPLRDQFQPTHEALAAYDTAYDEANDRVLTTFTLDSPGGPFRAEFEIPLEASGPCHVCAQLQGRDGYAIGSLNLEVRK